MKLTYRGHAYDLPAPVQASDSIDRPKLKLMYRGRPYLTTSRLAVSEAIVPDHQTVTLIYRGNPYAHNLQPSDYPKSYGSIWNRAPDFPKLRPH